MTNSSSIQAGELFSRIMSAINSSNWDTAELACKKILELNPGHPDATYILGLIYQNTGKDKLATTFYENVPIISNSYTDALNNLGTINEASGDNRNALRCYKQAAQHNPLHFQANYNYGRLSRTTGDLESAITALGAALEVDSGSVPALIELGITCKNMGRLPEALQHLHRASEIDRTNPAAYNILGNIYQLQGDLAHAISSYQSAIQAKPDYPEAHNNLGSSYVAMGNVAAALKCYKYAHELRPDWDGASSNYLLAMNYVSDNQEDLYLLHKQWGESLKYDSRTGTHATGETSRSKVRVGYVSPDLRAHSVAWFLLAILQNYNRDEFHVTCFSDTASPDSTTSTIKSLVDDWQHISDLPDDEVCNRIQECDIDILVDLAGHTANNRLGVFVMQASPVQVSYLGYPNTTGLSAINYRITDNHADPVGEADRFHTEKLVRLPGCFLCYSPVNESPDCSPSPCLNNNYITFCSFNVLAKLSDDCIQTWAEILRQTGESRLLLKSAGLNDPDTRTYIRNRFATHYIEPHRIEMLPRTNDMKSHLHQYSRADIALDTFPYNGTTTTCEALWMGVPAISLSGNRHAGRVGNSLLTRLGLTELVAGSTQEYISIATRLADETKVICSYRDNLRKRMSNSPLCDGPEFTRTLENAYREML